MKKVRMLAILAMCTAVVSGSTVACSSTSPTSETVTIAQTQSGESETETTVEETQPEGTTSAYALQEEFLKDMKAGLDERWAATEADDSDWSTYSDAQVINAFDALNQIELDYLEAYQDTEFEDTKFNQVAHKYIDCLVGIKNIKDQYLSAAITIDDYVTRRDIYSEDRYNTITRLHDEFGLDITDEMYEVYANYNAVEETTPVDPANYETGITYDQLARTPDDYYQAKVKFTGKVIEAQDSGDYSYLRLALDDMSEQVLFCQYDKGLVSSRILENDTVTIYGESWGLYTYQSVLGANITIPGIVVYRIDQ